jgi:hypothetical protein
MKKPARHDTGGLPFTQRSHNKAHEARTPYTKRRNSGVKMTFSMLFDKTPQADDPVDVAVEHVEYLRRLGCGVTQAMKAIGHPVERSGGWDAVIWAYAEAFERERIA